LKALEMAFPGRAASFADKRVAFERQAASRLNRMRAISRKVMQKLRNPPEVVVK